MKRKQKRNTLISALLVLSCLFSLSGCEDPGPAYENTIRGNWYVHNVRGDFDLLNDCPAEVYNYIDNFFRGEYMTFITGDYLTFSSEGSYLNRNRVDNSNYRYIYKLSDDDDAIELQDGALSTFLMPNGVKEDLMLQFGRGELLSYISNVMEITENDKEREYLRRISGNIRTYVRGFNVNYYLKRNEPTLGQVVCGNFYGSLVNQGAVILESASMSLVPSNAQVNFVMNDPIRLQLGPMTGPDFYIEVPNMQFSYSKQHPGIYDFLGGTGAFIHPFYGPMDIKIQGNSYAGLFVSATIYINNNGVIYQMDYVDSFRHLFKPEDLATRSRERKAVVLLPEKK